jgi:hypothetical protein
MPVGLDDPEWMGFEGHGHRRPVDGGCLFDHLVKKGLVANVDPVEIADCQHGIIKRFLYFINILYYFHARMPAKVMPALNFGLTENTKIFS